MKRILFLLLCLGLFGCVTMPTQEEISHFDYGAPLTIDYQQAIKNYFGEVLFDPYSAVYEFEDEPRTFWYKESFTGNLYTGYAVYVRVNAKNRMGGYVGKQRHCFIFKDNKIIKIISPEELEFMQTAKPRPGMVQDEKYGNIPDTYFLYLSSDVGLTKRAQADVSKIFNSYQKMKEYDKLLKDKKTSNKFSQAELKKESDNKLQEILRDMDKVIAEYGKENKYRAIYNEKMPNVKENDISDDIIIILNNRYK